MIGTRTESTPALGAVWDIELREAFEQAEAIRRAGEIRAEAILAQARTEAAALIERRCAAAQRLAELDARELLAEARARARETVLRAQQSVLSEARAATHARATRLLSDPRLLRMFERLAADARERLAFAGPVEIAPVAEGGFVARAGSREIDCSLSALVDRFLDVIAGELEELGR